jgi:hypothetical protein
MRQGCKEQTTSKEISHATLREGAAQSATHVGMTEVSSSPTWPRATALKPLQMPCTMSCHCSISRVIPAWQDTGTRPHCHYSAPGTAAVVQE